MYRIDPSCYTPRGISKMSSIPMMRTGTDGKKYKRVFYVARLTDDLGSTSQNKACYLHCQGEPFLSLILFYILPHRVGCFGRLGMATSLVADRSKVLGGIYIHSLCSLKKSSTYKQITWASKSRQEAAIADFYKKPNLLSL